MGRDGALGLRTSDGLHHRWMSAARTACGGSSSGDLHLHRGCSGCLYYGGGRGCAGKCPKAPHAKPASDTVAATGVARECSSSFDEAEVGGGRVLSSGMPNLHQIRWRLRVSLEMFFFV